MRRGAPGPISAGMKTFLFVGAALAALCAAVIFGAWGWLQAGGVSIGMHGWIALTLGTVLTAGVGAGLMALVFFSSRRGYDEAAHWEDPDQ